MILTYVNHVTIGKRQDSYEHLCDVPTDARGHQFLKFDLLNNGTVIGTMTEKIGKNGNALSFTGNFDCKGKKTTVVERLKSTRHSKVMYSLQRFTDSVSHCLN